MTSEHELFAPNEAAAYLASALRLSVDGAHQLLIEQVNIGRLELWYPYPPEERRWCRTYINGREAYYAAPPGAGAMFFADQVRAYARTFKPNLAGRKSGSDLEQSDSLLLPVMRNLMREGKAKGVPEAARLVVGKDGSGAKGLSSLAATKVDRLCRLYRKTYRDAGKKFR
jgi:hypothetical protein